VCGGDICATGPGGIIERDLCLAIVRPTTQQWIDTTMTLQTPGPTPSSHAPACPPPRRRSMPGRLPRRPKVLLIATGGTIAGVQNAPGTLGGYRAGTLTAEQIIASVPELTRFAQVETEQFSNVASGFITPEMWVQLAKRINTVLQREDLAGVVVTHGTDRLEETAFFLYLTVRSTKPVVVVGAQRPATGISPDGPINLLAAVRTAASSKAVAKGVMVVMDDRILSARESRKLYQRTGGFSTGDMGMLGVVASQGPEFFFAPVRRFGPRSEFAVGVDTLPRVELTYSYPGKRTLFDPAGWSGGGDNRHTREGLRCGCGGVAAFPSNNITASLRRPPPADTARPPVTERDSIMRAERTAPREVVAQHLLPQKARILLMVALTRTRDPREIQRMFREY
jgi:L-asparaginase/Glu-tRNA(Gln) amidotransferase subunit D